MVVDVVVVDVEVLVVVDVVVVEVEVEVVVVDVVVVDVVVVDIDVLVVVDVVVVVPFNVEVLVDTLVVVEGCAVVVPEGVVVVERWGLLSTPSPQPTRIRPNNRPATNTPRSEARPALLMITRLLYHDYLRLIIIPDQISFWLSCPWLDRKRAFKDR